MNLESLYGQVEAALAADIASGKLQAGERLPSEPELAERFNVSRITIRRAVQNLIGRGLLQIQRGRGTFVAQPKISQDLTQLTGFVEDMQAQGRKASAKVLAKEEVIADADTARQLRLARGSFVVRIVRIRLADGAPISYDETYLPLELGRRIVRNDLRVEPIFSLLEKKYQHPLTEADYQLEAVVASAEIASALRIAPGAPMFRIERTSYTSGNLPIDFERLYYRGDMTRFVTRLKRNI
jgi:GntR family transcriptional regulator